MARVLVYPNDDDPRSIQYALWKHNLIKIRPDHALSAFYQDTDRERVIHGLSKEQLRNRFGYLKEFDQVTPYYQACYAKPTAYPTKIKIPKNGKEVVFLQESPWMVVLEKGKVESLVLCKGY